jgi:GcrA cell cycle regulator
MRANEWPPERVNRLRELASDPAQTLATMAEAIGVTLTAIRVKLAAINTQPAERLARNNAIAKLWAEGKSQIQIGRSLGMTPSQVAGVISRMGLRKGAPALVRNPTLRPEIVRLKSQGFTNREIATKLGVIIDTVQRNLKSAAFTPDRALVDARAPKIVTLPKLPSVPDRPSDVLAIIKRVTRVTPTPRRVSTPRQISTTEKCKFPIGDPRAKGFRWCDCPAYIGGPYCPDHHNIAYVRVAA